MNQDIGLTATTIRDLPALQAELDHDIASWKALAPYYVKPMRSPLMRELADHIADLCDDIAALTEGE
jgi:hypothetical protein